MGFTLFKGGLLNEIINHGGGQIGGGVENRPNSSVKGIQQFKNFLGGVKPLNHIHSVLL